MDHGIQVYHCWRITNIFLYFLNSRGKLVLEFSIKLWLLIFHDGWYVGKKYKCICIVTPSSSIPRWFESSVRKRKSRKMNKITDSFVRYYQRTTKTAKFAKWNPGKSEKDDKEKPGTWYNFTQKGKPSAKSYDSESTKLSKASGNLMKLKCPPQGQGPES